MKKTPSYGRIKETTIGGIFMPRSYRHIQQYEKEILELRAKGLTHREIAERLGFEQIQIKEFFHRYNRNQRKQASGIPLKRKGRPRKDENKADICKPPKFPVIPSYTVFAKMAAPSTLG